jgi:hypothetical protein
VSRKINIKSFRLGEAAWWQTRTPPKLHRDITLKITENVIKGMFKKFRFLISDLIIHRNFNNSGKIIIFGTNWKKLAYRKRRKLLIRTLRKWQLPDFKSQIFVEKFRLKKYSRVKSRYTVYLLTYLNSLFRSYLLLNYMFSFRQIKKVYKNSGTLLTYIAYNKVTILKMMRRVLRRVKRDSCVKRFIQR